MTCDLARVPELQQDQPDRQQHADGPFSTIRTRCFLQLQLTTHRRRRQKKSYGALTTADGHPLPDFAPWQQPKTMKRCAQSLTLHPAVHARIAVPGTLDNCMSARPPPAPLSCWNPVQAHSRPERAQRGPSDNGCWKPASVQLRYELQAAGRLDQRGADAYTARWRGAGRASRWIAADRLLRLFFASVPRCVAASDQAKTDLSSGTQERQRGLFPRRRLQCRGPLGQENLKKLLHRARSIAIAASQHCWRAE